MLSAFTLGMHNIVALVLSPSCVLEPLSFPKCFLGTESIWVCNLCFGLQGVVTFSRRWQTRWLSGKESACQAGDSGSIPGLGRSPGNGSPLQYSCLDNSMDRGAWWTAVHGVAKSQTQLSTHTQRNGWWKNENFPYSLPIKTCNFRRFIDFQESV